MAVVALTLISSVVVTNIYQNNITDCVRSLLQRFKGETNQGEETPSDADRGVETEPEEPVDKEKYWRGLARNVDRILFNVWLLIYILYCIICLLLITK